ncbi:integrase core domain protein [Lasius niger]|uniref:Integrase core domain protein n=1 Tax=Lasius niger TaxID=67767 RepID=A0A0J7K4U9_LASNI|nr:integrase core domain protein [Lasius niger]
MNVSTYIAGLTEIKQRLKSLGETVSRETRIAKIIRGLPKPKQFNSFREVWRITPNPNLTVTELQGKLMDIEKEFGKEQIVSNNPGDALMSREKQRRTKQKSKQHSQSKGSGKKTLRCHNCDGIKHFAKNCPSKKLVKGSKKSYNKESSAGQKDKEAFMIALSDSDSECWMADSGAYRHITRRKEWFSELKRLDPPERIRIGDDKYLDATAKGTIDIWTYDGNQWQAKIWKKVRYCPDFRSANLFSIGVAAEYGHEASFTKNGMVIKGPDGGVRIVGVKKGATTYKLMIKPRTIGEVQSAQDRRATWQLWHQRLGHACLKQVKAVLRSKGIIRELLLL